MIFFGALLLATLLFHFALSKSLGLGFHLALVASILFGLIVYGISLNLEVAFAFGLISLAYFI